MDVTKIKIYIHIIATLTSGVFLYLTYLFPLSAVFYLSLEVIILPTIYIVGSFTTEEIILRENEEDWDKFFSDLAEIEKDNFMLHLENEKLKSRTRL
ncbi:hypothetical protein CL616_02340 [archaeon]|nr:hypothetical protein [archaeon]